MASEVASRQLERILHLVPRASGPEGVSLTELAAELGVSRERLLRDIEEVTARDYYHPAGWIADLQISVEEDLVTVWTTGELRRPVRLSPREALALALGLRLLADASGRGRGEELLALAGRLDRELASVPAEPMTAGFALDGGDPHGDGLLALLRNGARERWRCRLAYLKPGETEPEPRLVDPYALVFSRGHWYVIGHSLEARAVRVFRLDRMLEAEPTAETFEVPDGFDAADYVEEGAVFRAGEEVEAVVRYSRRIARWIAERETVEEQSDGSVIVRRRVADPRWIVRHVLSYGPEAEILEPVAMRDLARETVAAGLPAEAG